MIALALVGNAFCAACPLMLTRGLTRRLERLFPAKIAWPRGLKNKFLVAGLMVLYFFSYEYFDLWASPWLTAWLAVGYFGAALAIDTLFRAVPSASTSAPSATSISCSRAPRRQ